MNIKAVSVESPPQVSALPPTWFIGFRRARLWPLSASRPSSTDLLPPSALPRSLRSLRLFPPALRRADYRQPPVIVLPLWFFVFIVIIVRIVWDYINRKGGGCSKGRSISLYSISTIRDLETHDYSGEILRQWYAKVSARPPLSGTHYGLQRQCSARVTRRSAAVEKPPPKSTQLLPQLNKRPERQ